ncbi:MAG: hypothetical protein GOMPHAMPRED_006264 [Gomphillus americanus]|uniref:choline-phosphate cytidylyltransferase n=1 Tax=Gomphillus americanus TaxID=1940652 RepID=A0A8H3EMJ8_9LECA|nr:MAG: hypothetical protein GOMPHAMPRED_006264 [Gomphillus americanus]
MSSSSSPKRKRISDTKDNQEQSLTAELLQPSSRDASGEDAAEDSSTGLGIKHKKAADSVGTGSHPTKRARTRSSAAETMTNNGIVVPTIQTKDTGEISETTEGSADIEKRSPLNKSVSRDNPQESKPMEKPAKGGIVDPVGYHTNPPPVGRQVRVYADGVFDLFHLGHMRQLEQAKTAFPNTYLLVGVTGDVETHRRKGLTVLTGAERAETVRHCKWVDEVLPNCPWIITPEFLDEHQIDYVAHDDIPYGADEGDDLYKPIKEQGKFLVTQRTEGVSTTGIITKIVRDYEKYISRQFKRGASRQELNVSWLKKNELDLKRHVIELRDSVRQNWSSASHEVYGDLRQLWEKSRPSSPAPFARTPSENDVNRALRSPTTLAALGFPGRSAGNDFAAGYSLGLVGGVRSWMRGNRTSLRDQESQPGSPGASSDEDDSDGNKSPVSIKDRGRKENRASNEETTKA